MTIDWRRFGALALFATCAACGDGEDAALARQGPRAGGGPGAGRAVAVDVAVAGRGAIGRSVTVTGVVEPIRTIGVNSRVGGALLSVLVEEGDAVRRGQVLARLDDRELRADLAAAEAGYQVASAAYERARQLREQNIITLPEYERDRTAHAAAAARLEQLRARLGYTVVNAPIAGLVVAKEVEAGDVVAPQTRLFDLADVSLLVVRVGVSELDVVELRPGARASVELDAYPGRVFSGRIRRIFPAADPTARLVPVEVALEGADASVARPGFLARVAFTLGARDDVLLVPASAVITGTGGSAVFVVEGERAERRPVTLGLSWEGQVEIVSGVQAGDRVVVAGANELRDGASVRVMDARTEPPGAEPPERRTSAAAAASPSRLSP